MGGRDIKAWTSRKLLDEEVQYRVLGGAWYIFEAGRGATFVPLSLQMD